MRVGGLIDGSMGFIEFFIPCIQRDQAVERVEVSCINFYRCLESTDRILKFVLCDRDHRETVVYERIVWSNRPGSFKILSRGCNVVQPELCHATPEVSRLTNAC